MRNINFNKIIIVSLCDRLTKSVGKKLSQSLDMMYCDAKDLVEYELIDKNTLKKFSSKEYFDNAERSVFKHISSFENVVVTINFDYLSHNVDLLKEESLIVFLKLSKTYIKEHANVLNSISYDNRTAELENLSNLTVTLKKTETDFVVSKIVEEIGRIV